MRKILSPLAVLATTAAAIVPARIALVPMSVEALPGIVVESRLPQREVFVQYGLMFAMICLTAGFGMHVLTRKLSNRFERFFGVGLLVGLPITLLVVHALLSVSIQSIPVTADPLDIIYWVKQFKLYSVLSMFAGCIGEFVVALAVALCIEYCLPSNDKERRIDG